MDNDMVSAAANVDDPDATVDLQPPAPTPSNNRTLTASSNKTLSAAEAKHQPSISEDEQQADDTTDITTDVGDGGIL